MATVVLTGVGSPGQLGETVARTFAERGVDPILVGHRDVEIRARVDELQGAGFAARGFACDLADSDAVASLASSIARECPNGLDALVHMAGGFAMSGPVAESAIDVWERQISINLTTAFFTTRALLPQLRRAKGAIVLMASASALPGGSVAEMSAYAVAKSGVLALMRAIAAEERKHGVRANAVAPAAIRTASNVAAMGDKLRYVERQQVADVISYLCSPEASAVTGQVVALT